MRRWFAAGVAAAAVAGSACAAESTEPTGDSPAPTSASSSGTLSPSDTEDRAPASPFEFDDQRIVATHGEVVVRAGTTLESVRPAVSISDSTASDQTEASGAEMLANGFELASNGPFDGAFIVTVPLPTQPDNDAIPAVWHLHDDGTGRVTPGIWDPDNGTISIHVREFSDFYGGWWDPRNYAEFVVNTAATGIRVGADGLDFVADWATGRTDPPECRRDEPWWAGLEVGDMSSVHVCFQTNISEDGRERAEVFLKSNRSTMQMITVPTGADYVWVQGQPEWMRTLLRDMFADGNIDQAVVLFGGRSMSFGFTQPGFDLDVPVSAYQTYTQVVTNHLVGALGGLEGQGVETLLLVTWSCTKNLIGLDAPTLPVPAEPGDSSMSEVAKCAIELLKKPEIAAEVTKAAAEASGLDEYAEEAADFVRRNAKALKFSATAFLNAINVAGAGVRIWDGLFDQSADGTLTLTLLGHGRPASTSPGAGPSSTECDEVLDEVSSDFGAQGDVRIACAFPDSLVAFDDANGRPTVAYYSYIDGEMLWNKYWQDFDRGPAVSGYTPEAVADITNRPIDVVQRLYDELGVVNASPANGSGTDISNALLPTGSCGWVSDYTGLQLVNGEALNGGEYGESITLIDDVTVTADLTSDGRADTVGLLQCYGGGNSAWNAIVVAPSGHDLYLLGNQLLGLDQYQPSGTIAWIDNMFAADGALVVEWAGDDGDDPNCCPSLAGTSTLDIGPNDAVLRSVIVTPRS